MLSVFIWIILIFICGAECNGSKSSEQRGLFRCNLVESAIQKRKLLKTLSGSNAPHTVWFWIVFNCSEAFFPLKLFAEKNTREIEGFSESLKSTAQKFFCFSETQEILWYAFQQEGRCHAAIPSPIFLRNSIIPKRNSSKLNLKRKNVFCFTCILAGQARQLLADVRRFLLSFFSKFRRALSDLVPIRK